MVGYFIHYYVLMKNYCKTLLILITLCLGFSAPVLAQGGSLSQLEDQADEKAQRLELLEDEIAFTGKRLKASQLKLKGYEDDLEEKQKGLTSAQARYKADPTPEKEQLLKNAEKRVELAELSIKSRVASVARLESKEKDLSAKLASLKGDVNALSKKLNSERLAAKVEQKTSTMKGEMEQATIRLQRRLETLQRENERLRQVSLLEAEKRENAELRATEAEERARLAEQSLAQYQSPGAAKTETVLAGGTAGGNLDARERALAEMERVTYILAAADSSDEAVGSKNLRLRGDDGTNYGFFQYLGAQQYRADAVIHKPVARFRVAGRTYRVKVSETGVGEEFVFLYDMRDPDAPRFVTFKKSLLDNEGSLAAE